MNVYQYLTMWYFGEWHVKSVYRHKLYMHGITLQYLVVTRFIVRGLQMSTLMEKNMYFFFKDIEIFCNLRLFNVSYRGLSKPIQYCFFFIDEGRMGELNCFIKALMDNYLVGNYYTYPHFYIFHFLSQRLH